MHFVMNQRSVSETLCAFQGLATCVAVLATILLIICSLNISKLVVNTAFFMCIHTSFLSVSSSKAAYKQAGFIGSRFVAQPYLDVPVTYYDN